MTHKNLSGTQIKSHPIRMGHGVWLLVFLAIWELIARLNLVNPLLLPRLSNVLIRLAEGLMEGTLLWQWLQSIGLVLAGLAAGTLIGLLLSTLDYFSPTLRTPIELLSAILHPLPGVAILPIVLLIAGLGTPAVMLVIIHATVWSAYLSFQAGFRAVPQAYIDIADNLGAGPFSVFYNVLLPLSENQLISGLKIGWSRGWRALISAEMIFSSIGNLGGIGWYLFERRAFMDIEGVYSAILLMILTGYSVENLLFKGFSQHPADRP